LPSAEKEGVKPGEHYDGVGPLPGSISETSVAKLPDERLESAVDKSSQRFAAAAAAGATSLPSKETKGVQPREHFSGVGPLPGSNSETSVAKLPEERAAAAMSEERSGAAVDERPGPVQDAPSSGSLGIRNVGLSIEKNDPEDPTSVQKAPEREREEADAKNVSAAESKFKEDVAAKEKADRERKEDRRTDTSRSAEERAAPREPHWQGVKKVTPPESPGAPVQRRGRSSSDSDASYHKKVSVMNKVKGEMKVLLGKASRNRDKVEEGEKLKHGSD